MRRAAAERKGDRASWWALTPTLLAAAIAAASFLKSDLTQNDFERFHDLRLTFLPFALLGSAGLAYAALCLEARPWSRNTVLAETAGAGAMLLLSFPVGSKDVFLYAFTGKLWQTYGVNPYLAAPAAYDADPWQPFVQVVWAQQPSPYGPLFLWQARLVAVLAGDHLFAAVWLFKAIGAVAFAAMLFVASHLLVQDERRWQHMAFLAWNPLLLFESVTNGHNDAVMVAFIVTALWAERHGDGRAWALGPAAIAFAVWYKWYAILFVPPFVMAAWRDAGSKGVLRWLAVAGTCLCFGSILLAIPFASALPEIAARLRSHENLRQIFPLQLSPVLAVLLDALDTVGASGDRLRLFDLLRAGLFAASVAALLVAQWRGRIELTGTLCLTSLAFTMLAVTILWPWHLMLAVTLALLAPGVAWLLLGLGLTLLGVLSYFFEFPVECAGHPGSSGNAMDPAAQARTVVNGKDGAAGAGQRAGGTDGSKRAACQRARARAVS